MDFKTGIRHLSSADTRCERLCGHMVRPELHALVPELLPHLTTAPFYSLITGEKFANNPFFLKRLN